MSFNYGFNVSSGEEMGGGTSGAQTGQNRRGSGPRGEGHAGLCELRSRCLAERSGGLSGQEEGVKRVKLDEWRCNQISLAGLRAPRSGALFLAAPYHM